MQQIYAKVAPQKVWAAWEKAHSLHSNSAFAPGQKAKTQGEKAKGFKYKIIDLEQGESFTILWKSYFARLLFTHRVRPQSNGSLIEMGFQIKGPFAWPLRWMLEKKIQKNLAHVLAQMAKQLEQSDNHF